LENKAVLALENGVIFEGTAIGVDGLCVGEVVFNTAITGYQEILTDPSYTKQIITLTYPHIGNTGINLEDNESPRIWASGLVIRNLCELASNWRSQMTLSEFLIQNKTVAIADIDTRKLTRILRESGSQKGAIISGSLLNDSGLERAISAAREFSGLKGMDLVKQVSSQESYVWNEGSWHIDKEYQMISEKKYKVVALDFGVKSNILRLLVDRGCEVLVVPAKTSFEEIMALTPDGVFLSNGPGDPYPCKYAIETTRALLTEKLPIFGICLGLQILGLASGMRTKKMLHGHHGANHPVQNLVTGEVMITSQNHGFCLDENDLPSTVTVSHRSLFDNSIQGIRHKSLPAFGFQGHPEASPGPHDVQYLFDDFVKLMKERHA
tara:strand:+ start:43 stop:1182 length:1140 start_codon:yes stop_codon:yes gene_type:complete